MPRWYQSIYGGGYSPPVEWIASCSLPRLKSLTLSATLHAGQRGFWVEALSSIDRALVFYNECEASLRPQVEASPVLATWDIRSKIERETIMEETFSPPG